MCVTGGQGDVEEVNLAREAFRYGCCHLDDVALSNIVANVDEVALYCIMM